MCVCSGGRDTPHNYLYVQGVASYTCDTGVYFMLLHLAMGGGYSKKATGVGGGTSFFPDCPPLDL